MGARTALGLTPGSLGSGEVLALHRNLRADLELGRAELLELRDDGTVSDVGRGQRADRSWHRPLGSNEATAQEGPEQSSAEQDEQAYHEEQHDREEHDSGVGEQRGQAAFEVRDRLVPCL